MVVSYLTCSMINIVHTLHAVVNRRCSRQRLHTALLYDLVLIINWQVNYLTYLGTCRLSALACLVHFRLVVGWMTFNSPNKVKWRTRICDSSRQCVRKARLPFVPAGTPCTLCSLLGGVGFTGPRCVSTLFLVVCGFSTCGRKRESTRLHVSLVCWSQEHLFVLWTYCIS